MKARSCVRGAPSRSKSVTAGWRLTVPCTPLPPQSTGMQSAGVTKFAWGITEKVVPVEVRSGAQARRSAECTIASLLRWTSVNSG